MARRAIWKGTRELQLEPTYPQLEYGAGGLLRVSFRYSGPFETCKASAPAILSTVAGYPGVYVLPPVKVQHGNGDTGTLEFTASNESTHTFPDPARPIYEIQWSRLTKPLEQNARYNGDGPSTLSEESLNAIEEWKKESDADKKNTLYAALTPNAQDFVNKLMRGQDSFDLFFPIGRMTTMHYSKPATGGCGVIGDPPSGCLVSGYQYLKTADGADVSGKYWRRVQEWTGADHWDSDLYL